MGRKKGGQRAGQTSRRAPEETRPPLQDRRALERTMVDVRRLLEKQHFRTMEEANAFLHDLMSKTGGQIPRQPGRTAVEKAQDIMYDAWAAEGVERVMLALKALEVSLDCADAYVALAEEGARDLEEARELYTRGVAAGERALGKEMFEESAGHFWVMTKTRPYMRARFGLAMTLWELGEREEAVAHYQELLRLNPNDNQGVRDVLLGALLSLGREEEAGRLLEEYEEDGSATWRYGWALWSFRREGDSGEARRRLGEAMEANAFVPAYLLGWKRLPRRLPELIGFGDEAEAIAYAAEARPLWRATPGALEWLKSFE
jgi:tetratricopeptide (TPR) repeat protein